LSVAISKIFSDGYQPAHPDGPPFSSQPVYAPICSETIGPLVGLQPVGPPVSSDSGYLGQYLRWMLIVPASQLEVSTKWSGFNPTLTKNFADRFIVIQQANHLYACFSYVCCKRSNRFSSLSDVAPAGAKVNATKLLIQQTNIDGFSNPPYRRHSTQCYIIAFLSNQYPSEKNHMIMEIDS